MTDKAQKEAAEAENQDSEVDEAAAEATAEAAFSGKPVEEGKKKEDAPAATAKEEKKGEEVAQKDDKKGAEGAADGEGGEEDDDKPVQITQKTLRRLLAFVDETASLKSQMSKLSGQTGGLKNAIEELRKATPKGRKIKITDEQFKEFSEEYPEMAKMTRRVLESILGDLTGTGEEAAAAGEEGKEKESDDKRLQQLFIAERDRREMETLDASYPGWSTVIGKKGDPNCEFRNWLATKPEEYQNRVNNSVYAGPVLAALREFDESKKKETGPKKTGGEGPAARQPAQTGEAPKRAAVERDDRLRGAITPRGDAAPPRVSKTPEQNAEDAFNSEMAARR